MSVHAPRECHAARCACSAATANPAIGPRSSPQPFRHVLNEDPCRFRVDRIAIGAQASHSGGSAISQRECAGFNWPPLSIPAQEPISISPDAVCRAGPGSNVNACSLSGFPRACSARFARNSGEPLAECQSLAFGVAQPETNATVLRLLSLLPFLAGVPAMGVGQHANGAQPGRRSMPCDGPPFGPSC